MKNKFHFSKQIVLTLTTFVSMLLLFVFVASAADEYKTKDYEFQMVSNYLSIKKYIGDDANVVIPESVRINGKEFTVKEIGSYAFENNTKLKSITIPEEITKIGYRAFHNCTQINIITYNAKSLVSSVDQSFLNAGTESSNGISVVFGDSVKKIPDYLFSTNESYNYGNGAYVHVASITLSDSIEEVGTNAFNNCYDLKSVEWADNITFFGSYAFSNCYELTDIMIPAATVKIGYRAFYGCANLNKIDYNAKSLTSSIDASFSNTGTNSGGISVTFGSSVKKIPGYLFSTNESYNYGNGKYAHVSSVAMANSVNEIGTNAFCNCYDLKEINWSSSLQIIDSYAFANCNKIKKIAIPTGVKKIGYRAFENCTGVLTLDYNAKELTASVDNSFYNIGSSDYGVNVKIGPSVLAIPNYLFSTNNGENNCAHIKSVSIEGSVERIGQRAFNNCYNLESVHIESVSISEIGYDAFYNCTKAKIYCHFGTKTDYALYDSGVPYDTYEPFRNVSSLTVSKRTTTSLTLRWNALSDVNAYYIYEYNNSTKSYTQLAKVAKNKTTYKIKGLNPGTKHTFAVRGSKVTLGKTYFSEYTTLFTATKPEAVQTVKAVSSAKKTVKITVNRVSGANGYVVYYATSQNGKYKKLGATTKTAYTNKKLVSGTTYYFKIRAFTRINNETIYSGYSPVKSVRVK